MAKPQPDDLGDLVTLLFDTPRPKSAWILGLNSASTSNANFGLTISCL